MSLLDQLAFYSCKFDSFFPEFTNCSSNHPKNTKNTLINNKTHKKISDSTEFSCSSDFSLATSIDLLEQQRANNMNAAKDVNLIQKCSRLSMIGSKMEKKVLKLKYQFFIRLSNFQRNKSFISPKQRKQNLSQISSPQQVELSQKKQVQKEGKIQLVNNNIIQVNQMSSNNIFNQNQLRREIKLVKNIKLKQFTAFTSAPQQLLPISSVNLFQPQRHPYVSVPQSMPQMRQIQNPDLSDLVDIFIKEEMRKFSKNLQLQASKKSQLFKANVQKQLRNSHLKQFQDLQFTGLTISPLQKRRQSHTNALSSLLSESGWMSCVQQIQQPCLERKDNQKYGILFANTKKSRQSKNEKSLDQLQPSQKSNSLLIRKSFYQSQNKQKSTKLVNQSSINEEYSIELQRYIQFKRTIEKRKQSTLKQIQNSQQLITKLIKSFKGNKKTESLKKTQKSKEKNYSSAKKTPHPKCKYSSRNSTKIKGKQPEVSTINVKDLFTERNYDVYQQQTSLKTIQVFCNYVKQKQKMTSNKQSPYKTSHCLKTKNKQTKKVNNVDILLQSCKNVGKKQPRIELKVEIGQKIMKQKQQIKTKPKKIIRAHDNSAKKVRKI